MGEDERFVPTARFKRVRRDVKPRSDDRFSRLFDQEGSKGKALHKIDPFGRPIGNVSVDDVSSDEGPEELLSSAEVDSENEVQEEQEQLEYGDASKRLAVVGCDWDNISASDLFVLFDTMYRSITSKKVKCVVRAAIYLSDFGKERLEAENARGPQLPISEDVREEELGDSERHEALRKYQKERSRYYYGIVEFETEDQAKLLYDEMDGIEAYFTVSSLDLRFVPDTITFDRKPASECLEMPRNYEPPMTSESALRHSKVECKWDLPSVKRFKTLTKRFKEQELDTLDLKEYLASDDEDVDVSEYKSLVRDTVQEKEHMKDHDSKPSAKIGNYKISFGAAEGIPDIEEPILTSEKADEEKERKRNKRKRKNTKEADVNDEDDARDFDARLSRKEQQPGFEGELDDKRFKRVLKDPDFAIDTRHPRYRNTQFNKKLLKKKAQLK